MKTIHRNAVVFSGCAGNPLLEEFAVENGRFCTTNVSAGDRIVDLQGCFVAPSFIDAHTHPSWLALTLRQVACLPPHIHSIEDIVCALRKASKRLSPDEWIEGWGYDESLLLEGRSPTCHDLDRVCSDRPVF